MLIRTRFAPSPTGCLHIGNARVAIINYLFAKKNNGRFLLRIDDTDSERSTQESQDLILEDLEWLSINWDEFMRQSNNFDAYIKAVEYLKSIDRLYACYETKEELQMKRKACMSQGEVPVYDRSALALTPADHKRLIESGIKPYWRFKLSDSDRIEWNDMIHGKIEIRLNTLSDPILVKSDGSFVYTLASVVDDINHDVTHIVRGDDHITNTAVQVDLFRALGKVAPFFAHIPLLFSTDDKQDISKRTESPLSIVNMREEGILPKVIFNVLATMGTSENVTYNNTIEALAKRFSFDKISLASPKFDIDNLRLLNRKAIAEKSFDDVRSELMRLRIGDASAVFWDVIKGNITYIKDAVIWYQAFYERIETFEEDKQFLEQMLETLIQINIDRIDFDQWIYDMKRISGRRDKELLHPIRMILTGKEKGPELRYIVQLMGYERVKNRIRNNIRVNSSR
ncbi:MAG: glutamate--tRNA ligase [Holosporaceae bacterium]|jgi:glutamyl-tRNA synthetase|nr:glutamate--tRNA ligase [Holosporaceae bacterium]